MRPGEEEIEAIAAAVADRFEQLKLTLIGELINATVLAIENYRIKRSLLGDGND